MAMICVSGAGECSGCMACYDRAFREELDHREVLALSAVARRPITYARGGCRLSPARSAGLKPVVSWQEE